MPCMVAQFMMVTFQICQWRCVIQHRYDMNTILILFLFC